MERFFGKNFEITSVSPDSPCNGECCYFIHHFMIDLDGTIHFGLVKQVLENKEDIYDVIKSYSINEYKKFIEDEGELLDELVEEESLDKELVNSIKTFSKK
jgi:ribonucleotide reductase alpha subunit